MIGCSKTRVLGECQKTSVQRIPTHSLKGSCTSRPVLVPHVTHIGSTTSSPSSRGSSAVLHAAVLEAPPASTTVAGDKKQGKLKVLIAGAGIGGLVLAVALLKQGLDVEIFERDLTAIRGEGKYRGPIQVQSNALAALEAIDAQVAEEIIQEGCMTGDRINGLCDGLTGDWYVKFDMYHLAVDNGLPVTRVISRFTLQARLADAVERMAPGAIKGNSHVVAFSEGQNPETGRPGVTITLEDGRVAHGDMLIGADGIWSKIRRQLIGETQASYSEYTCYTGISDFTPADIDLVGYRVFLGNGKYFVSSDVGGGKMQWYGFNKEPAGGTDPENGRKARLLDIFGHWSHHTTDLIKATPEEDILRRDIFDRAPIFSWTKGRVALLGDSAHAMQPNLGQGGCMAIEDAYALALDLGRAVEKAGGVAGKVPVDQVLRNYQNQRVIRASTIHGMAGMAAFMASTYKAYLGEGLGKLGDLMQLLRIPHPGRVAGRLVMNLTMPGVLGWVLGGNMSKLDQVRPGQCRLTDKPRAFEESQFPEFLNDDEAIVRASKADWLLISERGSPSTPPPSVAADGRLAYVADACSSTEAKGIYIGDQEAFIGRKGQLSINDPNVEERHAKVWRDATDGNYYLQCLGTPCGTFVNGKRLPDKSTTRLRASDVIEFGGLGAQERYQIKLQHVSLRNSLLKGDSYTMLLLGKKLLQQVADQQLQDSTAVLRSPGSASPTPALV